jgi:LAO/AO transport system kinase
MNIDQLYVGIKKSEHKSISKAITLIESNIDIEIKNACLLLNLLIKSSNKQALRIGISGTPGVGKSTLIESLGLIFINECKKIAILTIDPSSPLNGGSILADRICMNKISSNKNVYIRNSPSNCSYGGIITSTYDSILILEAANFDIIFIETIGIGQSETDIYNLCDIFLLISEPNVKNKINIIKKGIIDLADILIINKCDQQKNDKLTYIDQYNKNILNFIKIPLLFISALYNIKVKNLVEFIKNKINQNKQNGFFYHRRNKQLEVILYNYTKNLLINFFAKQPKIKKALNCSLYEIKQNKKSIREQALNIIKNFIH